VQNEELNEYAHVVLHGLKAPLRNIDTVVNWVIEEIQRNVFILKNIYISILIDLLKSYGNSYRFKQVLQNLN
jgi:hypothetical protein